MRWALDEGVRWWVPGRPMPSDALELVHADDRAPGIRRTGTRRFRYVLPDGRPLDPTDPDDAATLERIRSLAVPPGWHDVWICPDECGHVQATGRDDRGRKQARYHPLFRSERENLKFAQLVPFGHVLPRLRRQVELDISGSEPTQQRQVALVVRLLDLTAMRVGNERYVRDNGSFGLCTLRSRQTRVSGTEIAFTFVGKSGRRHRVALRDRRLARLVAQCQDLPGQVLFTYLDETGAARTVTSTHVNDYLRSATSVDVTAKTFRTWTATAEAARLLAAHRGPPTRAALIGAVDRTAALLGNTRTVCRSSYIHPEVIERFTDGTLPDRWRAGPSRPTSTMSVAERRTLFLLEGAGRE